MVDIIPLKVKRNLGDTNALGEFEPGDVVPLSHSPSLVDLSGVDLTTFNSHVNNVSNPHTVTTTQIGAVNNSQLGVNNGVATLDGSGKVPTSQIPASALPEFKVVADATARLALVVQEGDEAKQLDDGSHWIFDGTTWHEFPSGSTVIFGTEFQFAESLGVSTTLFDENQTAFQNKLTMTTGSLPLGDYRVAFSYGWSADTTANDFEGKFLVNSVQDGEIHKQEPQDSAGIFSTTGTSQRQYIDRKVYLTQISGVQVFDLEYRCDYAGDDTPREASVWEARIEIWRVL